MDGAMLLSKTLSLFVPIFTCDLACSFRLFSFSLHHSTRVVVLLLILEVVFTLAHFRSFPRLFWSWFLRPSSVSHRCIHSLLLLL